MLLVHGGAGAAFQWGPILPLLATSYHVLAVDRPGHGLADPFDYCNVDLYAHANTFLSDLVQAEDLTKVELVGNSMGGLFTLAFALHNPEHVERLWLVGVPGGLKRRLPIPARAPAIPVLRGLFHRMLQRSTRAGTRRLWRRMLVAHPERLGDEFLELEAEMNRRNAPSIISLLGRFIDWGGIAPEFVVGNRWEQVQVSTTFVIGDHDKVATADEVRAVVARNARFSLCQLPDVGHVPWVDDAASVAQALGVVQSAAAVTTL
jgi:pimeloyl-ACP methyl ester carboxylesterase